MYTFKIIFILFFTTLEEHETEHWWREPFVSTIVSTVGTQSWDGEKTEVQLGFPLTHAGSPDQEQSGTVQGFVLPTVHYKIIAGISSSICELLHLVEQKIERILGTTCRFL